MTAGIAPIPAGADGSRSCFVSLPVLPVRHDAAVVDWGSGSYETTAAELGPVSEAVVEMAAISPGQDVIDLACGTGNAAPPPTVTTGAASTITITGATVTAAVNPNGTPTTDGFDVGTAHGAYTQPVSAPSASTGTSAATVSATLTGLSPNTTYYYRARATNPSGTTLGTEQSFTTPATPPGCPPNCPPVIRPAVRPAVAGLSQSASKWREGNKLGQITKKDRPKKNKPPVGTTFGFSLNEPAAVRLDFTQRAAGRKVSKKCVPASKQNRKKANCTRTVIAGTLAFNAHSGANRVRFQGRLSATKKLKPGRYTLTITATSAGLLSTSRSLRFTIVKG